MRCPRCGTRGVFDSWFKLSERCPRCRYRFVREEGFWLGAYVINFGLGEAMVGLLAMGYLFYAINRESAPLLPWLVTGAVLAVAMPILLFPMSRTVWAAFDLAMRPLEPHEEVVEP